MITIDCISSVPLCRELSSLRPTLIQLHHQHLHHQRLQVNLLPHYLTFSLLAKLIRQIQQNNNSIPFSETATHLFFFCSVHPFMVQAPQDHVIHFLLEHLHRSCCYLLLSDRLIVLLLRLLLESLLLIRNTYYHL